MFVRNYYKKMEREFVGNTSSSTVYQNGLYVLHDGTSQITPYSTNVPESGYISYEVSSLMRLPKNLDTSTLTSDIGSSYVFEGGVIFGDGTTPPTIEDYWMSGNTLTGLVISRVESYVTNGDGSGVTLSQTYTITNNNDAPVTIGEVGIAVGVRCQIKSGASNGYQHWGLLFERTVLEEPITIEAGGVGQVTYNITLEHSACVTE